MTVQRQIQEALANAKSVQANFEVFAQQTKDEVAKEKYDQAAQDLQNVISSLEERMKKIKKEETTFDN
ncbi:DUF1657 domain-containing protein [Halalkalibacter hemicellulosilyticus]|uniref:DUF1657 domain-containing protein n=1 Tax=Halalkalibacter hemicellulosilyticusJCM 9152 TaxID=1236971 RepID=W4QCM4_9BACI|nr:DUF1657 domain-containing protein [Halalkalibacter hemicellulosilyticus]GAE29785.1 hypothetical protein JCM9152_1168 [Halalkalibacter hemicellulosilyticusJCM 9152]